MLTRLNIDHETRGGYKKLMYEVKDEIKDLIGATKSDAVNVEVVMRNMSQLSAMKEDFVKKHVPLMYKALHNKRMGIEMRHYDGCGFWAMLSGQRPKVCLGCC